MSLFDENIDSEEFADMAYEYLAKNHGTAMGHFNGDENPPVAIETEAAEIEWDFSCGHCGAVPKSAVPISEKKTVRFVPYGCTELRITEIPWAADNGGK